MANPKVIPYAVFGIDEEYSHLTSPEHRLYFQVLIRAIEDAILPCNRKCRKSAVNWFKGIFPAINDDHIQFTDVCNALQLSSLVVKKILKEVLNDNQSETKRKSWRERVC